MGLKLAVYGGSGLTGSELLNQAIKNSGVEVIYSIGRKRLDLQSSKLIQLITEGTQVIDEIEIPIVDAVICCLGTTIKKAGSQDAFREVDVNIPVRIARSAKNQQVHTFIVQSSIGAGNGAKGFYLKCKTEMEKELISLNFPTTVILRPSLLMGKRQEYRFAERFSEALLLLVKPLLLGGVKKYRAIAASDVAKAMLISALESKKGCVVLESDAIQKLADSFD